MVKNQRHLLLLTVFLVCLACFEYSNLHFLQCMIGVVEVGRYRKVISPVDDISAVLSKGVRQPASSLPNVHC